MLNDAGRRVGSGLSRATDAGRDQRQWLSLLLLRPRGSPSEEVPALLYAQHWAETDGEPEPAVRERVKHLYREEALEQMEIAMRMIRVAICSVTRSITSSIAPHSVGGASE